MRINIHGNYVSVNSYPSTYMDIVFSGGGGGVVRCPEPSTWQLPFRCMYQDLRHRTPNPGVGQRCTPQFRGERFYTLYNQ